MTSARLGGWACHAVRVLSSARGFVYTQAWQHEWVYFYLTDLIGRVYSSPVKLRLSLSFVSC